jgi:hypothetical protein
LKQLACPTPGWRYSTPSLALDQVRAQTQTSTKAQTGGSVAPWKHRSAPRAPLSLACGSLASGSFPCSRA